MDRDELAVVVRVNQAGIYRYLRYLGADRPTAEDLVQETFWRHSRAGGRNKTFLTRWHG